MNKITPAPDDAQWQATIAAMKAYLKDCRTWLASLPKEVQPIEVKRKPSATAKSTHVYLLSGHDPQPPTVRDRSGCMPLWVVLGDSETRRKTAA